MCASGLDSEVVCGRWGKPPPPVAVRPYGSAAVHQGVADAAGGGGGGAARGGDDEDGGGPGAACAFSFRGDSRWLGVAKAGGADIFAGLAASGAVVNPEVAPGPPGQAASMGVAAAGEAGAAAVEAEGRVLQVA